MAKSEALSPKRRALLVGVLLATLVGVAGVAALGARPATTILPGTRVGSVTIGGLTTEAAATQLTEAAERVDNLDVVIDGDAYPVSWADWGIALLPTETAEAARWLGDHPNPLVAGWNRIRSFFRALVIAPTFSVHDERLREQAESLAALGSRTEVDATLTYQDGAWQATESVPGRVITAEAIRARLLAHIGRLTAEPLRLATESTVPAVTTGQATALVALAEARTSPPILVVAGEETVTIEPAQLATWTEIVAGATDTGTGLSLRLNQTQVESYVKAFASRFETAPVDAKVTFRAGAVAITQESQAGRDLDERVATAAIVAAWVTTGQRRVELPFTTKQPEVSSDTLASLGLRELIGKATTSYVGSPENRQHNIANGVSFLTSKLIRPGAEFSTVESLGAVDNTTGYLPELVIKENRTTPEYGGGLCQVSTTLFRAALNAGLKITERQNHSYRVSYYERGVGPGLDATIYLPRPDLKFLNDTPGWILVQGYVVPDKNEVVFELYGTSDGRRSTISAPTVFDVTPAGEPIYVETADLVTGEVKQIEKPHEGAKTTVTYTVSNADGTPKFDQTFRSTYKAWPARYLVGTAPAPAAAPAPEAPPAA